MNERRQGFELLQRFTRLREQSAFTYWPCGVNSLTLVLPKSERQEIKGGRSGTTRPHAEHFRHTRIRRWHVQ